MLAGMAQQNHNLDETLRFLSKEADFRTFAKLKALTNASDSEFLNGQLFVYYRRRQGDIPFSEVFSLPEEASQPVKGRLLRWLVRWRRLLEPWEGEALHSAIGEIKWALSRGMGEDLAEYLGKAAQIAEARGDMPAMLELLALERQVVMTYWATGELRIKRLTEIAAHRQSIIQAFEAGQADSSNAQSLHVKPLGIPRRVKSDLLYRLCNTLTEQECAELRRHIQLHRKDAKQMRLLEYYRRMLEWSRDQEKRDWKAENLSKLKSNTLSWLMRNMARYGEWQGAELHHLIGDLKWAATKGIVAHLSDYFPKAITKVYALEAHEIAIDLHGFGLQHLSGAAQSPDLAGWALRHIREVEAVQLLRLDYFEPIRIQNKATGFNHVAAWQSFQAILADKQWEYMSASIARREVLGFQLLAKMSLNTMEDARRTSIDLLRLLSTTPALPALNWARYFEELRVCCQSLVLSGHSDEALKAINQIEQLENSYPYIMPNSTLHRLLALSYVYDATGDASVADLGLRLYSESKEFIKRADDGQRRIWLLWFIAKASLDIGNFIQSKESLNEILDNKTMSPLILVAHSRVRLLLTQLGTLVEPTVVYHAANASIIFLRRNDRTPKFLQQIANFVKKIAQFDHGTKEQIAEIEKTIEQCKKIPYTGTGDQSLSFDYLNAFEKILYAVKKYQ